MCESCERELDGQVRGWRAIAEMYAMDPADPDLVLERAREDHEAVGKLPGTADGVRILPGMTVYAPRLDRLNRDIEPIAEIEVIPEDLTGSWGFDPEECYASRAAAEAAS